MNSLNFETRIEAMNLSRAEGDETKKIFYKSKYFISDNFKDGTYINLGMHLNAGIYHIEKYNNPKNESFNSATLNPLFPQLTLELTKPYIKRTRTRTIIKPQVLFLNSTLNAFNRIFLISQM